MTHPSWNLRTSHPTSRDVRVVVWLAFLGVVVVAGSANAWGANPTAGPFLTPPSRASVAEDRWVEIHARDALTKDKELGPLNLGVRMTSGIAHLFGPVPSAEHLAHARQLVQQVSGVLEVRTSEVYIAKQRPRGKSLPLPIEDGKPTQTRSASLNPLPDANAPVPSPVSLLAPEAFTPPLRRPEQGLLTAKTRTPAATSIPTAIDRLRQRDARFRSIRTEVQGTTVRIYTGETAGEKVMAFAQAITRLAGVQRVVVQDTSFRPR